MHTTAAELGSCLRVIQSVEPVDSRKATRHTIDGAYEDLAPKLVIATIGLHVRIRDGRVPAAFEVPVKLHCEVGERFESWRWSAAGYTKGVRDESKVLKTALKKLNEDMVAAQLNQADPAVPAKLKADVQAVNDSVARLKAMKAPGSLSKFSTDLNAALDQIKKGADGIAEAVDTNNQATGLAAFADLSGGEAKLDAAIATLPA